MTFLPHSIKTSILALLMLAAPCGAAVQPAGSANPRTTYLSWSIPEALITVSGIDLDILTEIIVVKLDTTEVVPGLQAKILKVTPTEIRIQVVLVDFTIETGDYQLLGRYQRLRPTAFVPDKPTKGKISPTDPMRDPKTVNLAVPITGRISTCAAKPVPESVQPGLIEIDPADWGFLSVSYFGLNETDATTDEREVVLIHDVTNGPPTHYRVLEVGQAEGAWMPYEQSPAFSLSAGNGRKLVKFRVKGRPICMQSPGSAYWANNVSELVTDDIRLTGQPLTSSASMLADFVLQGGAEHAISREVTLDHAYYVEEPTHYRACEAPCNPDQQDWIAYDPTTNNYKPPTLALEDRNPNDSTRLVYLRIKGPNHISTVQQASIKFTLGERCFGAVGRECTDSWCADGVCQINGGSIRHDECCFALRMARSPRQCVPALLIAGKAEECDESWDRAVAHATQGLNWERVIDFEHHATEADVDLEAYCAKEGARIHVDDAEFCCNQAGVRLPAHADWNVNSRICN